jgi:DNA-binding NarL/FixJ family response regulator
LIHGEGADIDLALAGDAVTTPMARGPPRQPLKIIMHNGCRTASELRVAGMAARGMTNREIAQALFLTENTIETHLRSVFRKLQIRSRSQLARAL